MQRYVESILKHRKWVIAICLIVTAVLAGFSTRLKVVIDPAALAPQGHPFIQTTNEIEKVFGSKYLMIIGVSAPSGDALQPQVLGAVERITRALEQEPGIVKSTLLSLYARPAKGISASGDGFSVKPLLATSQPSAQDITQFKSALQTNPMYVNTVVSSDLRTAIILVELKERPDGFQKMVEPIQKIVAQERSADVEIRLGGNPIYLEKTEQFAERINLLFPIALLVIGLLHYEAFRTKQGFILPLVTALMAVVWGTGAMGLLNQALDIFNSPTPILILAIAAGHAVQLLKRYYEEYDALRRKQVEPQAANYQAVIQSVVGVGPVMLIAGGVAALGFFSLLVFKIETIRIFGLFTGCGILSALVLEMTFIPAIRSMLKPPAFAPEAVDKKHRIWNVITDKLTTVALQKRPRTLVLLGIVVVAALCVSSMRNIVVDNASKNFFASNLPLQHDDDVLNRQTGGTNSLYIMIDGGKPDAIKSPAVLQGMKALQRYAEQQPQVGKTLSFVDYLERMNQAMHADQASAKQLPQDANLVSQYLLLYSISGEPNDFDAHIDYNYQRAKITILLKTGSNAYIKELVSHLQAMAKTSFGPEVRVTFGGDVTQTIALTETMVDGKIRNIVQIGLAIFLISAVAFRSVLAGVLVLLPLGMAVVAVFGCMGLFGIPLNIPNSLISAMAVGIGADYAIYFLYRLREYRHQGLALADAMAATFKTAGQAALYVATAVAAGYSVLALSIGYNVHLWLSLFIVLAMLVSVFASLTLIPGLVMWLKPSFIEPKLRTNASRSGLSTLALVLLALVLFAITARWAHAQSAELSAVQIMERNVSANKVRDSVAIATFTLVNKEGATRVRKTQGLTRLRSNGEDNMRLVSFQSPADIKGTATLLIENSKGEDDMWIYLPALGKVRRLSAANKRDAFVGTDFSYADVIGYKVSEWQHRIAREEVVDGAAAYVIESTPATDKVKLDSGYGKRVSWIDKKNFMALKIEIADLSGQPLKTIVSKDIQSVGKQGKWQAMYSEARNLQTGHHTQVRYDDYKAEQSVPESRFTPAELEK